MFVHPLHVQEIVSRHRQILKARLVLSGQSNRENVSHALSLGAADFIPKPCDPGLLKARLQHQAWKVSFQDSNRK